VKPTRRYRLLRTVAGVVVSAVSVGSVVALTSVNATHGAAATGAGPRANAASGRHAQLNALPPPAAVAPYPGSRLAGQGVFRPAGRLVNGVPAVYTTSVQLPGPASVVAGIAWMDMKLLRARLYSGSLSPGGLFWRYTAPISQSAARGLVAAFNGGFLLKSSNGGYLSEGHLVAPLRAGGASLVIYRNGSVNVGQWGRDVGLTSNVVAVRQNLTLLVDHSRVVSGLNPSDIAAWGASLNGVVNTPRSGLGVTANGALVYIEGPMNIVELAQLLVRAGAVRAMTLDMNPLWPVFATYAPAGAAGFASPANGHDLTPTMLQTPARFFEPAYARDFVTVSVR
jgi:hypothetical protein